jgi:hypothetical protein
MLIPETMTAAIRELQQIIERTPGGVSRLAKSWDVPPYILYDWRQGKTRCPRGRYLPRIARGMGKTTDELIDLCERNGDSPANGDGPQPTEAA